MLEPEYRYETQVYCTVHIEGIHRWKDCPLEEVAYLRDPHRHMFHIKAFVPVLHDDRDVEFIMLKHKITEYLITRYWSDEYKCLFFDSMSCEMIARELIDAFDLTVCEVSEDGENGSATMRYPVVQVQEAPEGLN